MVRTTRKHVHQDVFEAAPEELFAAVHTPSAICSWWGASRAIVMPEQGRVGGSGKYVIHGKRHIGKSPNRQCLTRTQLIDTAVAAL